MHRGKQTKFSTRWDGKPSKCLPLCTDLNFNQLNMLICKCSASGVGQEASAGAGEGGGPQRAARRGRRGAPPAHRRRFHRTGKNEKLSQTLFLMW